MTRVSVALCTYNGAAYLREQLASILAQTRPVDEIVIGDDGSTDGTLGLVRDAVDGADGAAPRLVVLPVAGGLGVTKNFERTALATSGDVVAFSDQDDVWRADRIAEALRLVESGAAMTFSDARLVDAGGTPLRSSLFGALGIGRRELGAVRADRAFETLLRRNLVTGATMTVTRAAIERAAPFPEEWVHDEWLAIVTAAFDRLGASEELLVDYRQHGGNQIGARAPSLGYKIRRVLEPRGDRYAGLERRALLLLERLIALGAKPERIGAAGEKLEHQRARAALPPNRLARIPVVAREAIRGRYAAYSSQGSLDVVRDLLSSP